MRARMLRIPVAAAAVLSLFAVPAEAGNQCVSYSVTTPQTGTVQGTQCVPMPDPFNFPISVTSCRGIPPAGVTMCTGANLNLPLP